MQERNRKVLVLTKMAIDLAIKGTPKEQIEIALRNHCLWAWNLSINTRYDYAKSAMVHAVKTAFEDMKNAPTFDPQVEALDYLHALVQQNNRELPGPKPGQLPYLG